MKTHLDKIPLNDERCSVLSIYLIDELGKMWTTKIGGAPYMMVREAKVKPKFKFYICAHCKARFKTYEAAENHY